MWTKILHFFGIPTKDEVDKIRRLESRFQSGRVSSMENRARGNKVNIGVLRQRIRELELEMVRQGFWDATKDG